MDRLSIIMVRTSLIWLMAGVVVGGLMLIDRAIPGSWRLWLAPVHGHMLFVGWFLQFALGIAYWLLPRKRREELPLGYRETTSFVAVIALNAGLLCRVIAEPVERAGNETGVTLTTLALSAVLQIGAVALFLSQIWPRIYGRNRLGRPGQGTSTGKKT